MARCKRLSDGMAFPASVHPAEVRCAKLNSPMGSGRAAPSPLDTELKIELGEFSVAINSTKEPPASLPVQLRARSSLSVKDGEPGHAPLIPTSRRCKEIGGGHLRRGHLQGSPVHR